MNCPTCGLALAQLGTGEYKTLVGYSSPAGHNHDDNCVSRVYACVHGHQQVLSIRRRCHACDWVGKATCGCHNPAEKVDVWPDAEVMATKRWGPGK